MLDDIETQAILTIPRNIVAKSLIDGVVGMERQNDGFDLLDFRFCNVN